MKAAKTALVLLMPALAIACSNSSSKTTTGSQPTVAASPAATASPFVMGARANFEKHCTTCHGDRGDAGIVKVNNKTLRVPSLRTGHALGHTDEKLAKQITEGDDEMPAFKEKLTSDEINELVRYIRKDFQGK